MGGGIAGAGLGYMLSQILAKRNPAQTDGLGYYNPNQFMGPQPAPSGDGFGTDSISYA
jgi:hypothetical protein